MLPKKKRLMRIIRVTRVFARKLMQLFFSQFFLRFFLRSFKKNKRKEQ